MINGAVGEVIVIPAYNEGKTIFEVLTKTKKFAQKIVVVDDGSRDNTSLEAERAGVIVLRHEVNLGKGAALKTGCDYAAQQEAQTIITMDADGQHDPKEIPSFASALEQHDIAFGSRKKPKAMPAVFKLGNLVLTTTLRLLYGVTVEDSQCGYRGFRSEIYGYIRWDATDYYVETEMAIRAGKKKLKHTTIPIETIYADKYKGTTVLDGVMIVVKMIGWKIWR